jgi:hypothetical protein
MDYSDRHRAHEINGEGTGQMHTTNLSFLTGNTFCETAYRERLADRIFVRRKKAGYAVQGGTLR